MRFDLSRPASSVSAEEFGKNFPNEVERVIVSAGGTFDHGKTPSVNFGNAIDELSAATNRSRNELINIMLEFGVNNCEIKEN